MIIKKIVRSGIPQQQGTEQTVTKPTERKQVQNAVPLRSEKTRGKKKKSLPHSLRALTSDWSVQMSFISVKDTRALVVWSGKGFLD